MGATPGTGLGAATEVVHEWWNVALVKTLYKQLGVEVRAAAERVRLEAVPWKDPRTGEMRLRPTDAEKLVLKKRERRERLRLMSKSFGEDEPEAHGASRVSANGPRVALAPAAALGMRTVWLRSEHDWARDGAEDEHVHHVAEDLIGFLESLP